MPIQRSVQQQNTATKAEIQRLAARFSSDPLSFTWLCAALYSHELNPHAGILVRLAELPEQEGNLMSGVWLTDTKQFWEFALLRHRSTEELLDVELFANITSSVSVTPRVRGTGNSFGFLACQVLEETRCI